MSGLEIKLWGEPSLRFNGEQWPLRAPRMSWPLLALVSIRREPMERGALAAALWPDAGDSEARANLRRHLHGLSRAMPESAEPWIVGDKKVVSWNPKASAAVDVLEFERRLAAGKDREAADSYDGDFLEIWYEDAIIEERERLRSLYLDALDRIVREARANRDFAAAVRYAEKLLEADEWREDAVRAVMTARYQSGDRSGALAVYERFAANLRAELRTSPMAETVALRDAILAGTLLAGDDELTPAKADRETGVPFVGRATQLATIRNAWLRAARGQGSAIFISGEPGIGKSRLALELCETVDAQGGRALVGRTSDPEAVAFEPIVEALRDGLSLLQRGDLEPVWWSVLATLLPEVHRLNDDLPALDTLAPEPARIRLREAFVRLAAAIARRKPVAIVLEDLHWARPDTIDVVDAIARRVAGLPLVLVMTYRSGEVGAAHPLQEIRRRMQAERRGATIALARFGETEFSALARELLGTGAPADVAARILEISEGNPLFAVQLLRIYADTGTVPGAGALTSVGDAVLSRISRLPERARAIADASATIGGTFTVEELGRVGGWEEATVFEGLGPLLDARIVCERGAEHLTYGFTHWLIESAIRDALPPAVRVARQRRVAAVLEETRAGDPAAHALVAAHWEAAGEGGRAARAYLRAATAAAQRYAHRDALELARKAIALGLDDLEHFEALHVLLDASWALGEVTTHDHDLEEVERVSKSLDDDARFEALAIRCRFVERIGRREAHAAAIERAEAFAQAAGSNRYDGPVDAMKAAYALYVGDLENSERYARRAVDAAYAQNDALAAYRARSLLLQLLFRRGKIEEGRAQISDLERELEREPSQRLRDMLATAMTRYAVAVEDIETYTRARQMALAVARDRGDVQSFIVARTEGAYGQHVSWNTSAARDDYRASLAETQQMGLTRYWLTDCINLGCIEREIGHVDRAVSLWNEALPVARTASQVSTTCCLINLAETQWFAGDTAAALREIRTAAEVAAGTGETRLDVEAQALLGAIECANGDAGKGLPRMREAIARRRVLSAPRSLAYELCLYLEASLAANDLERAAEAAAELRPLYEARPNHQIFPARIALALARYDESSGDAAGAQRLRAMGRGSIEYALSRLTDESDRESFLALPHNRELSAVVR